MSGSWYTAAGAATPIDGESKVHLLCRLRPASLRRTARYASGPLPSVALLCIEIRSSIEIAALAHDGGKVSARTQVRTFSLASEKLLH
jgi:hypothetical protein